MNQASLSQTASQPKQLACHFGQERLVGVPIFQVGLQGQSGKMPQDTQLDGMEIWTTGQPIMVTKQIPQAALYQSKRIKAMVTRPVLSTTPSRSLCTFAPRAMLSLGSLGPKATKKAGVVVLLCRETITKRKSHEVTSVNNT